MEPKVPQREPLPVRPALEHARRVLAAARSIGGTAWECVLQAFWRDTGVKQAVASRVGRLPLAWLELPAIRRRHRAIIFGGPANRYRHFVDYAVSRWGGRLSRRNLRALCIGVSVPPTLEGMVSEVCGGGEIVTIDPDRELIERARRALSPAGNATFRVLDPDREPLPAGPFQFVVSRYSLHRFAELEFLFDNIERVLDPVGVFACMEYTGPNRLQYPDRQLALVNALLQLLPEESRTVGGGLVKQRHTRPALADMLELAPGCAKRSEDIPAVMRSRLKELERIPLGGSLLGPLLDNIEECFTGEAAAARSLLQGLITIEGALLEQRLLSSDYNFIAARSRAAG